MTDKLVRAQKLMDDFVATYNSGDAARAASFYAEDGVYMPDGHPAVVGRANVASYHQQSMEQLGPTFVLTPEETTQSGNLVVQWGHGTMTINEGDQAGTKADGKYLVVIRENDNGRLELLWDIDNMDAP